MSGAAAGDPLLHPPPAGLVPPSSCPSSKQGPSFSCWWTGSTLFSMRDHVFGRAGRVSEGRGKGKRPGSFLLGPLQGSPGHRGCWDTGLPGRDHSCFWEGY